MPNNEEKLNLNELYETYFDAVFKFCLMRLDHDKDAAADCAHDVFDRAADKADILQHHPNVGGWMMETAKRCIQEYQRRTNRELNAVSKLIHAQQGEGRSIIDEIIHDDEIQNVKHQILGKLSDGERALYELFFEENRCIAEISELQGVSKDAVKMRLYRLRTKLKRYINNIF